MKTKLIGVGLCAGLPLAAAGTAHASFHLMQIEQVIGGVDGDTTAQAIQLRMRASGQNLVSQARVRAWDATGSNPILIHDMTTNVSNSAAGARVLIATTNFANYTSGLAPNFVMTNPIPSSYFAAGRLTFEDDFGTIYWSLAWGGANYTGSNAGDTTNDADGNFGPPSGQVLPSSNQKALFFTGAAIALSTSNSANYALTNSNAVFTNNAGTGAAVFSDQPSLGYWDLNGSAAGAGGASP
jgi:hypothetical protein